MSLVWHVLPHYRMYTHQPVPEFYVASGDWLLWDRRRQQTQEIVGPAFTGRWKGSQPYVCSGDGEIKTFEANVGAVHLFLTPNTESLVAGQECSVSIYLGNRYSAKARFIRTQEENGITQWITHQQTTVFDYWVLEIAVDGQVEASTTIHQPSSGVTFAAGIKKSNSASSTFYAWLSDGSNERALISFGTAPMAHFGSGTGFLSVDFDDAQQVEEPAKITVQGGAFISPLSYLINGFNDTVSLSPTTLASRQNDIHNTCHSMRQVSTNFLKPMFRNFLEDNGGQAETTRVSVDFQVSYLPNNLLNSGLYDDTLPYAHCIAGYKHAMSAPIPDSDGPPLYHLPETRTRLKVLRVTPQFRLRGGFNTFYDVPSTDLQLVSGSFGDWAGSQEITGAGNIKYLISIHWSEQPSNPTASLEEAALTTGSMVFFSHCINISQPGISFLDYGDSPIFGGFSIGPSQRNLFKSQQSQGNWFEAVREDFFNGEVIKFRADYTMFTVQAVGT